jgi:hypothetical protein
MEIGLKKDPSGVMHLLSAHVRKAAHWATTNAALNIEMKRNYMRSKWGGSVLSSHESLRRFI